MMRDAFRRELTRFDLERALVAWDGLIAQQQAALEARGVPCMFISTRPEDREVGHGNIVKPNLCSTTSTDGPRRSRRS